jgi:uncharacterized membrane protein
MFTLTGMAHFVGMRAELIDMVPPALPNPGLLVTVTGALELAGAAGLLIPRTLLQIVFLSATLAVVISSARNRATESPSAAHSPAGPGVARPPAPRPPLR